MPRLRFSRVKRRKKTSQEVAMAPGEFDGLFTKPRPHILEKICLSLDYNTFKNCLVINEAWKTVLTATIFHKKAKTLFQQEILKDEEKLRKNSKRGRTTEVKKLLAIGLLDVDSEDEAGSIPLNEAADRGHKDVVQLLLDGGADPNKANEYGWTPLHGAAKYGHEDVVKLLLNGGADPNKANRYGQTPIHVASREDIANILRGGSA